MADIKKKPKNKIKKIDKTQMYSQKLKNNIVRIKEKTTNIENNEENTPTEYGVNQITNNINNVSNRGIYKFNQYGKKSVRDTMENIKKSKRGIKEKIQNNHIKKNIKQSNNNKIKKVNHIIKNTERKANSMNKIAKTPTNIINRISKKALSKAKTTAKDITKVVKSGTKATISIVNKIIAGTRALISALIAGGWIAVIIIILLCIIGLICSSVFGIFFSNEKSANKDKTMSDIVKEVNNEFTNKITAIQKENEYDDYEIKSSRTSWRDILSIYSVVVTNGKEHSNVIALDNVKENKIKEIFWEMNEISSNVNEEEREIEIIEDDGNTRTETVKRKILYIEIIGKTVEEMIEKYNLNTKQKEQLAEIRKDKYNSLWSNVIYGVSVGDNDIVKVALSQIGNVGGETFWSWYGFSSRVEWCACFVSWCANECGYIEKEVIPKFAYCDDAIKWFKDKQEWYDRKSNYLPKEGDLIFFDWRDDNGNQDNISDHVGIVIKIDIENKKVYTIEGNTSNQCAERIYLFDDIQIMGYGSPKYKQ